MTIRKLAGITLAVLIGGFVLWALYDTAAHQAVRFLVTLGVAGALAGLIGLTVWLLDGPPPKPKAQTVTVRWDPLATDRGVIVVLNAAASGGLPAGSMRVIAALDHVHLSRDGSPDRCIKNRYGTPCDGVTR